ncbi:hypothetical protein BDR06DRAFT_997279 [Suillus hirtellus]|nr:hypothetical protein BDR06DRAFT_997279 [Suillus hirtellus]
MPADSPCATGYTVLAFYTNFSYFKVFRSVGSLPGGFTSQWARFPTNLNLWWMALTYSNAKSVREKILETEAEGASEGSLGQGHRTVGKGRGEVGKGIGQGDEGLEQSQGSGQWISNREGTHFQAQAMAVILLCTCRRSFTQLNVYANHQRTCKKQKKHLSNALSKAKERLGLKQRLSQQEDKAAAAVRLWNIPRVSRGMMSTSSSALSDKSRDSGNSTIDAIIGTSSTLNTLNLGMNNGLYWELVTLAGSTPSPLPIAHSAETWTLRGGESRAHPQLDHGFAGLEFTSDQAIVSREECNSASRSGIETEHEEWCSPLESLHVVDDPWLLAEHILPQPPPMTKPALPLAPDLPPTSETSALLSRTLRFFCTLPNVFGLSHQYYSDRLPTHDPEELTTLENLTLMHSESDQDFSTPTPIIHNSSIEAPDAFHPYPNKSLFLLGNWFWNGGIQKSHKSFKELLRIINIRATCWNLINNRLGSSVDDAEAHDNVTFKGAGWKKTTINIKEKLANEKHDELFHYQPYELLWNHGESERSICVHDATHLTSFDGASLLAIYVVMSPTSTIKGFAGYNTESWWVSMPSVPHPEILHPESGLAPRHEAMPDPCTHRQQCLANTAVENLLKEHSLVPTINAFSENLGSLSFNLFIMLVVDLMHEFELGVWKVLFVHLLHILSSAYPGDELLHELNRRLSNQCAIPVFDALLPELHNTNVLALIGTCAHWHTLTKLRMHTDETLDLLNTATVMLGKQLHHFQKHPYSYSTEPGELEHRTSKARQSPHGAVIDEEVTTSPEAHFHAGKSQNNPENIPLFHQRHLGNPAIKDFLPKLQHFLLTKIKETLFKGNDLSHINSSTAIMVPGASPACSNAEDIINPSTSHCNVMLLGQPSEDATDSDQHPYLYARVLGIYHVNVSYISPGMINYDSQQINFLWVHWYQHIDVGEGSSQCTSVLDRVCFPPMADPDTFGFVDRDMFMRYQWGLGVGHTYAHTSHKATDTTVIFEDLEEEEIQDQGICDSDSDHSSLGSGSEAVLQYPVLFEVKYSTATALGTQDRLNLRRLFTIIELFRMKSLRKNRV